MDVSLYIYVYTWIFQKEAMYNTGGEVNQLGTLFSSSPMDILTHTHAFIHPSLCTCAYAESASERKEYRLLTLWGVCCCSLAPPSPCPRRLCSQRMLLIWARGTQPLPLGPACRIFSLHRSASSSLPKGASLGLETALCTCPAPLISST